MFNQPIIDFTRGCLLPRVTKPQTSIALYPKNTANTTLSVSVNSTTISIQYIASSTTTHSITYVDKSVKSVCAEINSKNIPILAVPLSSDILLTSGDLISTSGYKTIPAMFNLYDRTSTDSGIVIRSKKYTIRNKSDVSIKLLKPYNDSSLLPWYPRISVGSFNESIKGRNYVYTIPEFDTQVWSSSYGKPFVDIEGVTPVFLDDKTIQLPRYPIYWNGNNILMFNGDAPLSQTIVKDVDINNGLVYLQDGVYLNQDNVYVNYSYLERSYVYKHININGHFSQNPFILNKYVIVYLLPSEGSTTTPQKRSVYHTVADSLQDGIDKIAKNFTSDPYAIVGAYSIQNTYNMDELSILDTRVFGGGLIKSSGPMAAGHEFVDFDDVERAEDIENYYIEARNYADIGRADGEIYPGAAAIEIDLPKDLRDLMPENDIEARASKFVAAGVYPLFNYTERALPLVTGFSRQISSFINGDFSSSFTGAGWINSKYSIPGDTVYGYWESTGLNITHPVRRMGSEYYITIDNSGFYQSYLKSSPDAAITWDERTVVINTGSKDPYSYSEWNNRIIKDSKEVSLNTLSKGVIELKSKDCITQYKNIRVYSPYRADGLSSLKSKLLAGIQEITGSYSGIAGSQPGPSYNQIRYYVKNIVDQEREYVGDYFGISVAHNYLFNMIKSTASSTFTGMLNSVGSYFTGNITSGMFEFYSPSADEYYTTTEPTEIAIDLPLYQLGSYTQYLKDFNGTGSSDYLTTRANLSGVLSRLEFSNNRVLLDYTYSGHAETPGDDPIYGSTGIAYTLPENLTYPTSDVAEDLSEDHRLLNIIPSISSAIAAQPSLTGLNTSVSPYSIFSGMCAHIRTDMARVSTAANASRTFSGTQVAQSWYVAYDRYSDYLGNYLDNLTQAYDILYPVFTGNYTGTFTQYSSSNTSGNTPPTLDLIYSAIYTGLDSSYSGVLEHVVRNGVVEAGVLNTIKGYGWFANNSSTHCQKFGRTVPTGFISNCSGLYYTGMLSMIKNTVGVDGYLHETTYVDGEKGPFLSKVPVLVFNALAEGCVLNSGFYTPYVDALYNTLSGLYNESGIYWEDSLKQDKATDRNFELAEAFSLIYTKL